MKMTTESAWNDIQEKHEMAYFRGQLATEFPESYTLEEMTEISDGMSASTAEVDAMLRADFESMPPFAQDKMLDLLRQADPDNFDWWLEVLVGKVPDNVSEIA